MAKVKPFVGLTFAVLKLTAYLRVRNALKYLLDRFRMIVY